MASCRQVATADHRCMRPVWIAFHTLGTDVRVVVSNRADAAGLQWAREAGIETVVLPHGEFESRDAYTRVLVEALQSRGVKLVCLAWQTREALSSILLMKIISVLFLFRDLPR